MESDTYNHSSNHSLTNDKSLIEEEREAQSFGAYNGLQNSSSSHSITYSNASPQSKGTPSDPGVVDDNGTWDQWAINGANGINVISAWQDYTGEGVRVGVIDDGFNYNHSELSTNFRTDLDYDVLDDDDDAINDANDRHGTWVAQVIGADDNGVGNVGVAFDADLVGVRRGFNGEGDLQDVVDSLQYAQDNDFDIINNSWSVASPFADNKKVNFSGTDTSDITDKFEDLVEVGRDGLGANIVFGAGNSRAFGMSANYKNYQNSPYTISVGGTKEDGTFANFSEAGSNLLVSAAGNLVRVADATDDGTSQYVSGTSFAAPMVSGVIALMLEANPDLGYRDVQEILALSARLTDADGTGWAGQGWQINGATNLNGGGMHFSHDYGFGLVDATAAVRLAETWDLQQTYTNMSVVPAVSTAPDLEILDNSITISSINMATDIDIEHVIINLDISHAKAGDLIITLVSPDGTESTLVHHISNGAYETTYGIYTGINFEFTSVAHWGEGSAGDWTLRVEDDAAGNVGTLNSWSIGFLGNAQSADDLYVYTDEYVNADGAQTTLSDTNGGVDTINAAAVTGDVAINLKTGGFIAGKAFLIDEGTVIEKLYTGDGNDSVGGNDADNFLHAGRGDDALYGSLGNDVLDGAQGIDTLSYDFDIGEFVVEIINDFTVSLTNTIRSFADTVLNTEYFDFNGAEYSVAQLEDYVAGDIVETKTTLKWAGANKINIINDSQGEFLYSEEDIGISEDTSELLRIYRDETDYDLSQSGDAIHTAAITNHELTEINIFNVRAVKIYSQNSTLDVESNVHAMTGRIYTGSGHDTINLEIEDMTDVGSSGWLIKTGDGDDEVNLSGDTTKGYSRIYLGAGDDVFSGGVYIDEFTFTPTDSKDFIFAGEGDDVIFGGGGDDRIFGESGNNFLSGGDGNDRISAGADGGTLHGDAGNDRLIGSEDADVIHGGADNDVLYGHGGDDQIFGGEGNDLLRGHEGNDTLHGGEGFDRIYGDDGNDMIEGGAGVDFVRGGAGNDLILGGADGDKLYGDIGDDRIFGDAGFDLLSGGAGNDVLSGGDGNDHIYGNTGNDRLSGGAGNDVLYAGSGDDIIVGGEGSDRFYGAGGKDIFAFDVVDGNYDYLYTYNLGYDVINITDVLEGYNHGVSDLNDFVQFVSGGTNKTYLRLNVDGDEGGDFATEAVIFTDFNGQTVDDLLANNTLVADISA